MWSIIVGFTQLFLQINNKFGHGVLLNFIKGRYRNPRRENRIFMFLDLKSSTSIAEALGNEKYHQLLKDFFSDITNPIIYNKGEIYQYVGDGVVISWTLKNGIENSHCVKCYFDAREKIQALKDKYKEKYGLVPEFKAGLHYGEVIAGEIGIIKRDITYSGDVLNTTSRIQNKCNELNTEFLASTALVKLLQSQNTFNFKSLGPIELEGKIKSVELSMLI
ncbi:MAG: adenylate/guanylate cyclase domain-containing protein [Bacteroidetes bacterium]|nr:adenylate/guanylate cyclase domain-containing protein [Bacteroidota bacterium]